MLKSRTLSQHIIKYKGLNFNQNRTSFYNKYFHGPFKILNPKPDYWRWTKEFFAGDGLRFAKDEFKRIKAKSVQRSFDEPVDDFKTYIFEDFDSEESLKKWKTWVDAQALVGFSSASLSRSPAGHASFKGVLDTRCPDDGLTQMTGFAALMGPPKPRHKLFQMETFWDWRKYNMVEIKYRGDGRRYMFVLHTGSYYDDVKAYDTHAYPIYTRGGPHWQTLRIPFSKFIFCYKGLIQDDQGVLPSFHIKRISITLQDQIDGPFSLEIDHIGLRCEDPGYEEHTAYEQYAFPHLKYKMVNVDSPLPGQ